ncbi:unnamed protein product [Dicrocoelium dendriticum]|nr:unnamed protein product [Dicrocoelium dendriticum]
MTYRTSLSGDKRVGCDFVSVSSVGGARHEASPGALDGHLPSRKVNVTPFAETLRSDYRQLAEQVATGSDMGIDACTQAKMRRYGISSNVRTIEAHLTMDSTESLIETTSCQLNPLSALSELVGTS